jgi:transketolase
MRTAFINTLCELAEKDDRIWLLCGDLGYSVLEEFAIRFPDRYVNIGVAEQNMAGMAAGLAMSGKTVFVYSIANFPTMRCLEQIRNDICYHNANVKIVSVGSGYTYGSQGYTHHGVEDIAVMRVLPNMTVVAPGDPIETKLATKAIASHPSPCYLRLGKAGEPVVHQIEPEFQLGKAIILRSGHDATLISTGAMLELSVEVSDQLQSQGYSLQVISMPTVFPCDQYAIMQAARTTKKIITLEEHGIGGLGTIVAEILAEMNEAVKFVPLRLPREFTSTAGSQSYWRSRHNLSLSNIKEVIQSN